MKNLALAKVALPALILASTLFSGSAAAYTLTQSPQCNVAADVFDPAYNACYGAYTLAGGENDVTDGQADNIVTKLLNVDDVFGDPDWSFFGKVDVDGGSNDYFTVDGIGSTTGNITFNVAAIDAAFGPSFLTNYEMVISFKAAKDFSLYQWDAPIWGVGDNAPVVAWSTAGTATNNKGVVQNLSHASVYFRSIPVSEPSILGLLGLGMIGLGLSRRRLAIRK